MRRALGASNRRRRISLLHGMVARQCKTLEVYAAAHMRFGRASAAHLASPACDVLKEQLAGMSHALMAVHPQQGGESCKHRWHCVSNGDVCLGSEKSIIIASQGIGCILNADIYTRTSHTSSNSEPMQMSLIPAPSTITSGRVALHGIARLTDDCQGYWNGYGYDPAALDDRWLMGSRIRHRRVGSR